jgi:adenylosuccinate synthase
MLNGLDAITLTKLDVLDEFEEISICVGYRCGDERLQEMPYGATALAECEPIYETMPGWKMKTSAITNFEELPEPAKDYIHRIEELCGAPVAMVSTGPDRDETILRAGSVISEWMHRL